MIQKSQPSLLKNIKTNSLFWKLRDEKKKSFRLSQACSFRQCGLCLHFKDIRRFITLRDRERKFKFSPRSFGVYFSIISLRVIIIKKIFLSMENVASLFWSFIVSTSILRGIGEVLGLVKNVGLDLFLELHFWWCWDL